MNSTNKTQAGQIAFQGELGAYSEQALREYFGDRPQAVGCKYLKDVFATVQSGHAQKAIVPVENSIAGSIYETYDLLSEYKLTVVGEHFLKVNHCLLTLPNVTRSQIKKVFSHPQALDQSQKFLNTIRVEWQPFYDTAGAAKWVSQTKNPEFAAIASKLAAQHYNLTIMAEGIQTFSHNTTRFLVLQKESITPKGDCKTSIQFETRDIPAALYKCLGGFATNGVNLNRLESRPSQTGIGRYRFYLDCEGHVNEPAVDQALRELQFFTANFRLLGSYSKGKIPA